MNPPPVQPSGVVSAVLNAVGFVKLLSGFLDFMEPAFLFQATSASFPGVPPRLSNDAIIINRHSLRKGSSFPDRYQLNGKIHQVSHGWMVTDPYLKQHP